MLTQGPQDISGPSHHRCAKLQVREFTGKLKAYFVLQRWVGLRIIDCLMFPALFLAGKPANDHEFLLTVRRAVLVKDIVEPHGWLLHDIRM